MRELGGSFGSTPVKPGTNLLVAGPPMTGKQALAYGVLARGSRDGEGTIVVATEDNAGDVLEEFREHDVGEGSPVGVVDCVTRQQGGSELGEEFVRYTSSPADLTGIGIEFSELLEAFHGPEGVAGTRVLLDSISTLLMYSELQTVFRFLHVFTGRVQSADGVGLFVIDSTTHDQQTLSTLKQLFDGVVEVEEDDDGRRRARVTGRDSVDPEWVEV